MTINTSNTYVPPPSSIFFASSGKESYQILRASIHDSHTKKVLKKAEIETHLYFFLSVLTAGATSTIPFTLFCSSSEATLSDIIPPMLLPTR